MNKVPNEIFMFKDCEKHTCVWACRAIYENGGYLDIPQDRITWHGDKEEVKAKLIPWLSLYGINLIKNYCLEKRPNRMSKEIIEINQGSFTIKATPNASDGYLYIIAYENKEKENENSNT